MSALAGSPQTCSLKLPTSGRRRLAGTLLVTILLLAGCR